MKPHVPPLLTVALLTTATLLLGQQFAPPAAQKPDDATLQTIVAKTDKLGKAIASLRKQNVRDPALAETEIYHKAAVWIVLAHNE